jgi:hypothetical protein
VCYNRYISDVKRLVGALQRAVAVHGANPRRVIWRTTTPQHYATPSGLPTGFERVGWTWTQSMDWLHSTAAVAGCVPIANLSAARQRNDVAAAVLRAEGAGFSVLDTWDVDVRLHDQHARGRSDCTHWCLDSDATRHWLRVLLDLMVNIGCRA